ncbi:MAG: tetratricopeptide repeat protein [Xanthomonadales bacterium]|nr:tetratricopeptide repeat protein [Xanthomonadales bacterium]
MPGLSAFFSSVLLSSVATDNTTAKPVACDWEQAFQFLNAQQLADAEAVFQACSQDDPEGRATFYLGLIARQQQDLARAYALFQQALERSPHDITFLLEFAVVCEWQGNLAQAESVYQQVTGIEENNFPALLGLARLAHWQGRIDESLERYDALLIAQPEYVAVLDGKARALMADYRLTEAEQTFQTILASEPENAGAQQGLAQVKEIYRHNLELSGGITQTPGEDLARSQLSYSYQHSSTLRLGANVIINEAEVAGPPDSGIPINRAVKASYSAFVSYKPAAAYDVFFSYQYDELASSVTQNKFHLEGSYKFGQQRVFAAAIPSLINGTVVNTLTFAGYEYQLEDRSTLSGQFFYANDIDFADSKALSLSYTKPIAKKSWLRAGNSIGLTSGEFDYTLALSGMLFVTDQIGMSFTFVNNFDNNTRDIRAGLRYEF